MQAKMLLEYASIVELVLCVSLFVLLWRRRLLRQFPWLAAFVAVRTGHIATAIPLLFFRRELGISRQLSYNAYFYSFWGDFVFEALLSVLIIYAIYKLAMKPLAGLSRIGTIIFQWVMVVSGIVSVSFAIVPNAAGRSALQAFQAFLERSQQGINVLTLCLLVFVCFAIRPLGLTYRSRVFGVSLGLGIIATVSLIEAAWYSTTTAQSVYSPMYVLAACGYLAAMLVWGVYFAVPEPERKMVLLPTTSPFFHWNRISEALGDAPGFVAISGVRPEMLAPAELKVLIEGSKIAREKHRRAEAEQEQIPRDAAQSFHPIAMQR